MILLYNCLLYKRCLLYLHLSMVGSGCWKSTKLKVGHGRVNERARAAEVSNYTQNGAPEKRSGRTGIEDSMRARVRTGRDGAKLRERFLGVVYCHHPCVRYLRTSPNPTSLSFESRKSKRRLCTFGFEVAWRCWFGCMNH